MREWITKNGNVGIVTNEEGSSLYRPNMDVGTSRWVVPLGLHIGTGLSQPNVGPSLGLRLAPCSVLIGTTYRNHNLCVFLHKSNVYRIMSCSKPQIDHKRLFLLRLDSVWFFNTLALHTCLSLVFLAHNFVVCIHLQI